MKPKLLSTVLSAALLTAVLAGPAAAITKTFDFDDCRWTTVADDNHAKAWSATYDVDGGCSYIDADLKYFDGEIRTKYCSSVNAPSRTCDKAWVDHEQSRGSAKSWETDRWQYSGWWG